MTSLSVYILPITINKYNNMILNISVDDLEVGVLEDLDSEPEQTINQ